MKFAERKDQILLVLTHATSKEFMFSVCYYLPTVVSDLILQLIHQSFVYQITLYCYSKFNESIL